MNGTALPWITASVGLITVLGVVVTYLVSAGTKARRDMLEQDVTDLEKRLARREHERDEARRERDAARQELDALGRVVTAADAIGRFEKALAAHRSELVVSIRETKEFLQRIYDLIVSFRQSGGRRE